MNLKKLESYWRVNLLGPGPRLVKKEFTGPRADKGWETLIYSALILKQSRLPPDTLRIPTKAQVPAIENTVLQALTVIIFSAENSLHFSLYCCILSPNPS